MPTDFDEFLQEVPAIITDAHNVLLAALVTEEEVRAAFLFMMHPKKSHGPDGMIALFFQHWSTIKLV